MLTFRLPTKPQVLLHTLINTTPNFKLFFSPKIFRACVDIHFPCIYFTHKCVTRQRPWHKYDSMFHFYILLERERESEREVIASCVCDCVRLLFMLLALTFSNLFNSFFSGANFNISIDMKWKNTFFLLLNLNEFQRFFACKRESKSKLEWVRERLCEWRGNISYLAVDSLQFIFLNSSVSPECMKHRWRCLYDHASLKKGKVRTWQEKKLFKNLKVNLI